MPRNSMEYGGQRDEEFAQATPPEHQRAVSFVNAVREGNIDRAQIDDFVFGQEQAPRVGLEKWKRLQSGMEAEKLDDDNMQLFAQDLESLRREAKVELGNAADNYRMQSPELDQAAAYINQAIDGTVTRHILDRSEYYPMTPLAYQEERIQDTWLQYVERVIDEIEETHEWQYLNKAMRLLSHQADTVNSHGGGPPPGFEPALRQEAAAS